MKNIAIVFFSMFSMSVCGAQGVYAIRQQPCIPEHLRKLWPAQVGFSNLSENHVRAIAAVNSRECRTMLSKREHCHLLLRDLNVDRYMRRTSRL